MLPSIFGKKGCAFSMKTLLHSRALWVQLRRKKHWKHTHTHSLAFHQTHALMKFWLESVAVFVLMSIWRRWGWPFSHGVWNTVLHTQTHAYLVFLGFSKWHQLYFGGFLRTSTKQSHPSKSEEFWFDSSSPTRPWANRLVTVLNDQF